MTKEIIGAVLDRLKINHVVWIDDIFESIQQMSDDEIANFLSAGGEISGLCTEAGFSEEFIKFTISVASIDGAQALFLQQLETESTAAKIALTASIVNRDAASDSDFSNLQVKAIIEIFGERLTSCSFSDWPNKIDELIRRENTIFLVDLKNKKSSLSGKDVLHQLITKEFKGLITLFTHECGMNDEIELLESIRNELAPGNQNPMSTLRIGVVSKQRCHLDNITKADLGLVAPIHRLAMTTTFSYLADAVGASLQEGIANGVKMLAKLPITDIDRVVFQNSMKEGCSEIELVERLLFLMQREAITKSLKSSNNINALLAKARDSWVTSEEKYIPKEISDQLVKLRSLEVFDTDELINQTHSPLSNGDIFEIAEGKKIKQYILLMSPCDSMVRDDGTRQLDTGIFVLINENKKAARQPSNLESAHPREAIAQVALETNGDTGTAKAAALPSVDPQASAISAGGEPESDEEDENGKEVDAKLRYYGIPVNLEKNYRLDFVNSCPVVLDSLEWCVFNSDGFVRYNKGITPNLALLKGWERRLQKLKNDSKINKCQSPEAVTWPHRHLALKTKGFSSIHIVSVEKDETGTIKKGHLIFNLKRVKRLRSPYADAALSAYLNYTGRPAFEHEFIR